MNRFLTKDSKPCFETISNYLNDISNLFEPGLVRSALDSTNSTNLKHLGSRIYHLNNDQQLDYDADININQNQFFIIRNSLLYNEYTLTVPSLSIYSKVSLRLFGKELYRFGDGSQDLNQIPLQLNSIFSSTAQTWGNAALTLDVELFELTHVSPNFLQ